LVLAVGADRQWERFCRAVEHDDWLADPRFATNPKRVEHRDALTGLLRPLFAARSTDDWLKLLAAAEVPHARIASIDEVLVAPQTEARGMVQVVQDGEGRTLRLLGNPIHWPDRPTDASGPPPGLGRHTDEILAEWLDYEKVEIERLRSAGVIV
jgi:crotonobetainyl-CoA:carnitine CoA-transferase CaiB-like acyl-CoA transferase